MLWKGLQLKSTTTLLIFLVSKVFQKLVNNRIVDHREKCGLFLISSMVLGLFNKLQIFWQLCLIELLGLLTDLGATPAVTLDISKAFDRVSHAGLLHNLRSSRISGHVFVLMSSFHRRLLFIDFSVIDGLKWF